MKTILKKTWLTIAAGLFSLALLFGILTMPPKTTSAQAATGSFTLQKTAFREGEAIYVTATGSGTDWVGIFREGENSSVLWYYVATAGSGNPFNLLDATPNAGESGEITAGNYVVAFVPNDLSGLSNATQRQSITVVPSSSQLYVDKTEFAVGEPINVTAFGSGLDWVGIYRAGEALSARWYYVTDAGNGATVDFTTFGQNNAGNGISADLTAGNYTIYLIRNDGAYTSAEVSIPITVYAASPLRVSKTEFELKQPIYVTATHSDSNAWVGLYRTTESEYCRWYYVSTANGVPFDITKGEKNIETSFSPNVMRGDYYLRLFDNKGNIVAEIEISVIADPTIPSNPISASYDLVNDTDGFATGTVSVTMPEEDLTDRCIALFWGDDLGIFNGYSYIKFHVTGKTSTFTFGQNVIIPYGATKLYVYAKNTNGDALSTGCIVIDLPKNAAMRNPLGTDTDTRFWVISDTHVDQDPNHVHNQHFAGALQDIARIDGSAMSLIVNGDMTNRGRDGDWANFQAIYDAASGVPPMVLAMGNHEYYNGSFEYVNSKFYELAKYPDGSYVNKMHYDYWQGGYHFVFLGTDTWPQYNTHAVLTQDTLNWLAATLEEGKDEGKPTFLFLHQPLYDTVAGSRPGEDYSGVEASSEAALRAILASHPEVMLFVGHTHWTMNAEANMYEGTESLPTRMFNTSSAGYLWTTYDNASGDYLYGSEGYYLRVCGNTLYVMGYDFVADQWISAAQYCVQLGECDTCSDLDSNHFCDNCFTRLTECTDSDHDSDHSCDICGASCGTHDFNTGNWYRTQTQHAPYCNCGLHGTLEKHSDSSTDGDHFCDVCGYPASECNDSDKDHFCDDCEMRVSEHKDDDKNHFCDICTERISYCEDGNYDHLCNVCGERLSSCTDNDDHYCDYCDKQVSFCADNVSNHFCDICGELINECEDNDYNHLCDVCGFPVSECVDDIPDHVCDICDERLSDCEDGDNDHLCDHCRLPVSFCTDENPADHFCDICDAWLGSCTDDNLDHFCDGCNAWLACYDYDNDHNCDTCGNLVSSCFDAPDDDDHNCDTCGIKMFDCADGDGDGYCDGCGQEFVITHVCFDNDLDHFCDECTEMLSTCEDGDNDHFCDYCGWEQTSCMDDDSDHFCDICSQRLSECHDYTFDHICDVCSDALSSCYDHNHDGLCDHCFNPYEGDNAGGNDPEDPNPDEPDPDSPPPSSPSAPKSGGCGGSIGGSAAIVALGAACLLLLRKRED